MLYRGQSLFSLVLSLGLSSFLLIVILKFYLDIQRQNDEVLSLLQLQSEVQRAVQLMGKDMRRAGFRAATEKVSNLSWFEAENGRALQLFSRQKNAEANCAIFFYDIDTSGCIGSAIKNNSCLAGQRNATNQIERELFGYRLDKGMLETRLTYKSAVNSQCLEQECRSYLQQNACESVGWVDLFDSQLIRVHRLHFSWLIEPIAIQIELEASLKKTPHLTYHTNLIVPLLNNGSSQ